MEEKKNKKMYSLKHFYHKYSKIFMKLIPIIGIIILMILFTQQGEYKNNIGKSDQTIIEKSVEFAKLFAKSFVFANHQKLLITIVLIITLWTGFYYWIKDMKIFRGKRKLLKNLLIAVTIIIFFYNHTRVGTEFTKYYSWIIFLCLLYIVIGGSWFLAKVIDGISLKSDLYCWGLRLLGAIVAMIGIFLFISSMSSIMLTNIFGGKIFVFENIYWVLSVCLTLLGGFMVFRAGRRYPMIGVWNAN